MSTTNTINQRNSHVKHILESLYSYAINPKYTIDETNYDVSLNRLFQTTAWGFREILLVVIVGMILDKNYRASTALYDCNPRAIYEGPIKEFLISKEIPHRKSGPLNVAKATVGLDSTWAAQRRPSEGAEAIVTIVNYLEQSKQEAAQRLNNVGISLFRRLIAETKRIKSLSFEIEPNSDPDYLFALCKELIIKAPDAGNTPQRIAAFLLKNYHICFHTRVTVTGGKDRASVTSTTSKKPGDISEEVAGIIYKVYEITIKHFDIARIRDSYDCILIYNGTHSTEINEIIVICRQEDCPPDMEQSGLKGYLGYYIYHDIIYYFWDIFEWISNTLQHMTVTGRTLFYFQLNGYIKEANTSEAVKELWQKLHQ